MGQLKWLFLASATFFIVVAVGRGMFGKTTEEELAEFDARFPTKDSCLAGAAQRIAPCTAPGCYDLGWAFFDRCLDRAKGDKELFCANVLDQGVDSLGRDVFTTHCQPFSPYETECEKVVFRTHLYCSRII
jgi:hypothetical protein